jgi:hypothetical protein
MRHDPTGNFTQIPELYTKDKLQPSRPESPEDNCVSLWHAATDTVAIMVSGFYLLTLHLCR